MPNVWFQNESLEEFMYWANNDRKTFDKIYKLFKDIERNGAANGIGKPERLKHQPGWSRRIDEKNRLIYEVDENNIIAVKSCKGHYGDK